MVKNNYPSRRQAKKQTNWFLVISSVLIAVLLVAAGLYSVFGVSRTVQQTNGSSVTKSSKQATDATQSKDTKGLPDVSPKDWQLLLVNRDNKSKELNPEIADVDGVSVDARIAKNVKEFLAAAQEIDPSYHLISGYRSVAYQTELYNSYVQQEMAADPSLTESQAEKKVQTYSQPPGASEHQTGLAIDMSTVDSLNEADPDTVAKVKELAPKYGFVLRFPDGKTSSTGVGYEDWHFRYVGKESAEYMTEHNLTLEEYLALLILLPLILHASTDDNARAVKVAYTQQEFIETLAPTAQKMSKNYGVPASILLSQAAYESNYGSSLLSVKYHNIYSLPAQPGQERIRLKDSIYSKGKWQYQKVDFAVFKDWSSSMMTYLEELRQGTWGESTYKEVAGTTSYKVAAEKLQAAGFSSDPDYAKHLISIIETYHLSKYD